jgi:AGZA family xanthine/uracil permease-like MFS transporter
MFLTRLVSAAPAAATPSALIAVGLLMLSHPGKTNWGETIWGQMDWTDPLRSIPAFLALITIPPTLPIANRLGFRFQRYARLKMIRGAA